VVRREALVRRLYPEVDRALNWLNERASAEVSVGLSPVPASWRSRREVRVIASRRRTARSGVVVIRIN